MRSVGRVILLKCPKSYDSWGSSISNAISQDRRWAAGNYEKKIVLIWFLWLEDRMENVFLWTGEWHVINNSSIFFTKIRVFRGTELFPEVGKTYLKCRSVNPMILKVSRILLKFENKGSLEEMSWTYGIGYFSKLVTLTASSTQQRTRSDDDKWWLGWTVHREGSCSRLGGVHEWSEEMCFHLCVIILGRRLT